MSLLILFEFPRLGAFYLLDLYLRLHEHLQEPKEPFLLRRVNLGVYLRLGNIRHASQGYLHVLKEFIDVQFQLIVKVKLCGQQGQNTYRDHQNESFHAGHAPTRPDTLLNHTSKRERMPHKGGLPPPGAANLLMPPLEECGPYSQPTGYRRKRFHRAGGLATRSQATREIREDNIIGNG